MLILQLMEMSDNIIQYIHPPPLLPPQNQRRLYGIRPSFTCTAKKYAQGYMKLAEKISTFRLGCPTTQKPTRPFVKPLVRKSVYRCYLCYRSYPSALTVLIGFTGFTVLTGFTGFTVLTGITALTAPNIPSHSWSLLSFFPNNSLNYR